MFSKRPRIKIQTLLGQNLSLSGKICLVWGEVLPHLSGSSGDFMETAGDWCRVFPCSSFWGFQQLPEVTVVKFTPINIYKHHTGTRMWGLSAATSSSSHYDKQQQNYLSYHRCISFLQIYCPKFWLQIVQPRGFCVCFGREGLDPLCKSKLIASIIKCKYLARL